ncbi:MAG: pectate lyase [Limnochordia bacterium]|jgi:PelA/Pel-15E family pectate lyase|nr:pectate lyase [Bacillota bacterium]
MKAKTSLSVLLTFVLVLTVAQLPVLAGEVVWTKVDGTDFAGDDIWFTEMYGATNGFPLANQTVGDDPVVGRAMTLRKSSTAGRAMGRMLKGAQNTGLYKVEYDVKLPTNLGAPTRAAAVSFFEVGVTVDTNIRQSDNRHIFRIMSIEPSSGVEGGLYLDFKKNIANIVEKDDSWQITAANLEGAIPVTEIDPKLTPGQWLNVSAILDYNSSTAIITLTLLEGPDQGYSRTFATDLPGEDNGLGLMAVCGITKGGGSSWTAQIANISIYIGEGELEAVGRIRIDEEPKDLVVISNWIDENTRITAAATGIEVDSPLAYQWFKSSDPDGAGAVPVAGANAATYVIPADIEAGTHYYYCEISAEGADPVKTRVVVVTVREPAGEKSWGAHYPNEWRYIFNRISLMENNPLMYFNDELQPVFPEDPSITPIQVNGALLIPYQTAAAVFGTDVEWDVAADLSAVTVTRGSRTCELEVGSTSMQVGSNTVELMSPPMVINGILYLPAEAIASSLRLSAGWDAESGVLVITTGFPVIQQTVSHSAMNNQPENWYGSAESIRLANNLVLYQRNSGGWVKNIDMGGQMTEALKQQLLREKPRTDATLDNGVTIPEIRYLIRMYQATKIERYREAYMLGINGVLSVQYPNGGFPQTMHPGSSYHGEITFNDNAMTQVLNLWWDIYSKPDQYYSIDEQTRARIEDSLIRGIDVILDTQIYSEQQGMLTAWCAQHDRVTLEPSWARDYEPPSISGSESIGIINFLMGLDKEFLISLDQDNTLGEEMTIWERVQRAVHAAVAFFEHVEIKGYSHVTGSSPWGSDRKLVEDPNGRGLWARFIDIDTFEPLFFDRRQPTLRPSPREADTYRPYVTGAMPGKHYPGGGNLRNLYRDAEGNLHPIIVGPKGELIRPEGTVLDIAASYANLSHERRNGYQYIGGYAANLQSAYQAWLERNGLSRP